MLNVILIVSFAMCCLCSVRSIVEGEPGYAIAGAMFGLVFLLGFLLFRMPTSTMVSLNNGVMI